MTETSVGNDGDPFVWHNLENRFPGSYEWLYFDVLAPDETQLSISVLGPNPFDPTLRAERPEQQLLPACPDCSALAPAPARHVGVSVHLAPATGQTVTVQEFVHLKPGQPSISFNADPWTVEFGGSRIRRAAGTNGLATYTVELAVDGFSTLGGSFAQGAVNGKLVFEATQPAWAVRDALLFRQDDAPDHWHRWAVHVPRALVSGQCQFQIAGTAPIDLAIDEAEGYHDHNWGTQRLSNAFQRWMWARGAADGHSVIAASLVPSVLAGPNDLRLASVFAVGDSSGMRFENLFALSPSSPGPSVVRFPKTIEVGAGVAAQSFGARFEHRRVALDFGNYQRRVARLELHSGNAPEVVGLAVAETLIPRPIAVPA